MSKIKNSGLDQCGAERFEQQQFGTAGGEGKGLTLKSGRFNALLAGEENPSDPVES